MNARMNAVLNVVKRCLPLVVLGCLDSAAPTVDELPDVPRGTSHLLIQRFVPSGARSWYTMRTDGRFAAAIAAPSDARWLVPSPDGRTIAYLRDHDDLVHLWLMDRDGSNKRAVLEDETVINSASWSPDGTRLVIERNTLQVTADVMIVNRDGSGLTNLTPDASPAVVFDRVPAWSPDGNRIAFISNRSGLSKVWVMNANGSNPVQVQTGDGNEQSVAWSPDGVRLAFFGARSGLGNGVGVVRPDGTGLEFFPLSGDAGRVSWAPDGRVVYSTNNPSGNYEIYARDLATGTVTNITNSEDQDYSAVPITYAVVGEWLGFESVEEHTGAPAPAGIAAGDVTGDGHADILVASPTTSEVRLFPGPGHGQGTPLSATSEQREIVVRDVTADGHADIVVRNGTGFSLWRGGSGLAASRQDITLAGTPRGLAIRDRTSTGNPDIVTTFDVASGPFHLHMHGLNGNGAIVPLLDHTTSFQQSGRVCVGDVDGDGPQDFVILTPVSGEAALLIRGQGPVSLHPALVASASLAAQAEAVPVCADLDGDRRTDLVVLRRDVAGGVGLMRSIGTAFSTAVIQSGTASDIAAGDIDHDGDIDLIIASTVGRVVFFSRNLGDGTFAAGAPVALTELPKRVTMADVNGDGWLDVVIAGDGFVAVLKNKGRS